MPDSISKQHHGEPVFCNRGPGPRLELLLRPEAANPDAGDPLIPAGEGTRVARLLLGRIAIGEDTTVKVLAFKLRRDRVIAPTSGFGNSMLGNREIDAIWAREAAGLGQISSPSVISLLAGGADLPPITLCRRTQAYFHPPSARSGDPLVVCRDDQLLRACGLQTYSTSTARYLYASSEVATRSAERKLRFYTLDAPGQDFPQPDVEVRRSTELYRDLGGLVAQQQAGAEVHVASALPCLDCEFRDDCYPLGADLETAIPAESWLLPVTYYDSPVLPLEACELRIDELADILGGAAWSAIESRLDRVGAPGDGALARGLGTALTASRQFLTAAGDPRRPLEILSLKLAAFRQVCKGVRQVHALAGPPCFDISPATVMAVWNGASDDVPARWQFQVKLADIGCSQPYRPPAAGTSLLPDVWIPVADVSREYLSPLVSGSSLGRDFVLRFTVTNYSQVGDSYRVELEARTSTTLLEGIEVGDVLYVQPNAPIRQLAGFDLLARVTGIDYRVLSAELTLPNTALPEAWSLPFAFDGIAVAYPQLGPPCDMYPLGMLLFRMLLVNDRRSFSEVLSSARRVLEKFELEIEGVPDADAAYSRLVLRRLMREAGSVFGSEAVLFHESEREGGDESVSAELWSEILMFGCRLLTTAEGFAYATRHSGDAASPTALIESVMADLERFRTRLDVEQFGGEARDCEVVSLCESMLVEISEGFVHASNSQRSGDQAEAVASDSSESAEREGGA